MQKIRFIVIIVTIVFSSCQLFDGRRGDEQVARVNSKYLYKSDLRGLVAAGTSAKDSAVIIQRYIENWVRQQVYLQEAETNLITDKVNLNRKVEDYNNSLLIFSYENQLIDERLDTLITDELLQDYYEKHQNEFKLRDNIVKLNFVKLPVDAPDVNQVRRLIRSEEQEDIEILEEYCINHAAGYFLDQNSWFIFADILRELPINPSNHESYLRNNRFVELNDSYYRYFLFLREYKLEGSPSPLAFQIENLKAIIFNHRKQQLINAHRQQLYLNAVKAGSFEIY